MVLTECSRIEMLGLRMFKHLFPSFSCGSRFNGEVLSTLCAPKGGQYRLRIDDFSPDLDRVNPTVEWV